MKKFTIITFALASLFAGSAHAQPSTQNTQFIFGIMIENQSSTPIYASGGRGNWDNVAYGPVWQNTLVPPGGSMGGPMQTGNNGNGSGTAGYAISANPNGSGPNLSNFAFYFTDSCSNNIPLDQGGGGLIVNDPQVYAVCVRGNQPPAGLGSVIYEREHRWRYAQAPLTVLHVIYRGK
jgi:hypothetical protein